MALKYLKDTEVNLNNVLIMTGDFNIRNNLWNPNFSYHPAYRDILLEIADLFQLKLSNLTESFLTRYLDNDQDSNSVLDLVFLCPLSPEFDNYHIYPNWRLTSDHTSIIVNISILNEFVQTRKYSLAKNSKEERYFIKELVNNIKNMDMSSIHCIERLENIIQVLAINIDSSWQKYSKNVNITKHFKVWWNNEYSKDLNIYQQLRCLEY